MNRRNFLALPLVAAAAALPASALARESEIYEIDVDREYEIVITIDDNGTRVELLPYSGRCG